jgi:hypothetical protein
MASTKIEMKKKNNFFKRKPIQVTKGCKLLFIVQVLIELLTVLLSVMEMQVPNRLILRKNLSLMKMVKMKVCLCDVVQRLPKA